VRSASLVVHEPKTTVDLSKAMDNHTYMFDGVFGEASTNEQIFDTALRPMVRRLFECRGGHGTCFAYGQTGSGKTVTMEGLAAASSGNAAGMYSHVADEVFSCVAKADKCHYGRGLVVRAGFFEIYRGKCFDLLNKKKKIEVMEDERGQQQMIGLQTVTLTNPEQLLGLLDRADRTTKATAQNAHSSRSHAILQLSVLAPSGDRWQSDELQCKLSLVDLAGSEWAAKAQSDNRGNRCSRPPAHRMATSGAPPSYQARPRD
jgi:kinesin family protein 2/24